VGATANVLCGKGFRIIGDGELDILFTQYDLQSTQSSSVTVPNRYIENANNKNYLRTHTELGLGAGWGSYINDNRFYLDFSASYNFQVFFDQNMFRLINSEDMPGVSSFPNGNLYTQGLTLSMSFDF